MISPGLTGQRLLLFPSDNGFLNKGGGCGGYHHMGGTKGACVCVGRTIQCVK